MGQEKGWWAWKQQLGNRTHSAYLSKGDKKLTSLMALSPQWVILQLSISDKNKGYYRYGRGGKGFDTSPATSPVWPKWTSDCDCLCSLCWIIFLIKWTFFITKKKVVKMLEEMVVSQLANGQVNMAMGQNFVTNSFSFWRIGCATCGQTVSWRRTGPILSTNAGCKLCSFQCVSPICWACFSDVMVLPEFRRL